MTRATISPDDTTYANSDLEGHRWSCCAPRPRDDDRPAAPVPHRFLIAYGETCLWATRYASNGTPQRMTFTCSSNRVRGDAAGSNKALFDRERFVKKVNARATSAAIRFDGSDSRLLISWLFALIRRYECYECSTSERQLPAFDTSQVFEPLACRHAIFFSRHTV